MKRIAIMIAVLLLALFSTAAHAGFPGRNGAIVYQRWTESLVYDEESGDISVYSGGVGIHIRPGIEKMIAACGPPIDCDALAYDGSFSYGEPAVSPDGQLVALRAGNDLALVDMNGGEVRRLPHPAASGWDSPTFSPGGHRLAFTSSSDELAPSLWVSDLDGGRTHRLVDEGREPAWSTRNWIAFGDIDGGISRVRPSGLGLRSLVARGTHPAWSPDGTRLAFIGFRRSDRGLFTTDGLGRHLRRIPLDGRLYDVAWSPNGRKLLVSGEIGARGPGLVTVDTQSHAIHRVPTRTVGDIDTFTNVDWQPLPR